MKLCTLMVKTHNCLQSLISGDPWLHRPWRACIIHVHNTEFPWNYVECSGTMSRGTQLFTWFLVHACAWMRWNVREHVHVQNFHEIAYREILLPGHAWHANRRDCMKYNMNFILCTIIIIVHRITWCNANYCRQWYPSDDHTHREPGLTYNLLY